MFQYIQVKIQQIDMKKVHFQRAGYTYIGEVSPEEAKQHMDIGRLKNDDTILCFSHPLK
jgi:hypothetical protein